MDKTDTKDTQLTGTTTAQPDNKIGSPIPIISQQNIAPGAIKQRHLVPSPTQKGDMYYGQNGGFANLPVGTNGALLNVASNIPTWLPVGTTNQVLTMIGGVPTWTIPYLRIATNTIVMTITPNALNTVTHNLNIAAIFITAINGDYGANGFTITGIDYVNIGVNSFKFYALGGVVGGGRLQYAILY